LDAFKIVMIATIGNQYMNNQPNLFVDQKLSANDIIQSYINDVIRNKPQTKVFPNTYIGSWECDIVELTKSGYLYEYEVKITRADFKADAKKYRLGNEKIDGVWHTCNKSKYSVLQSGSRVNYFYYLVPKDLISVDEVPEFAGLIYIDITYVHPYFKVVKPAPKLSKEKITEKRIIKLLESTYYRYHSLRIKL